mmetsp:Transcript_8735/g.21415  ORF Transcript_8735/g.21415 Transcript_8735/m.21415 type:complete len:175 (+) Transcript_8735:1059-1583(+)
MVGEVIGENGSRRPLEQPRRHTWLRPDSCRSYLMNLPEFREAYSRENDKNNDSTTARMKQKKKPSLSWDWNTPFKFHRSCLAVRDLLRAVTESRHPVIMVIDDFHEADEDIVRLLSFLLTGDRWDQEQIIEVKKTIIKCQNSTVPKTKILLRLGYKTFYLLASMQTIRRKRTEC